MSETWTYASELAAYAKGADAPLTQAFLETYSDLAWRRAQPDREAAALLHIELASRISTQELGYSVGTETAALGSLRSIFGKAREICEAKLGATDFENICWFVLNHHLRPFTSRWHRRSETGRLAAIDDADDFRLELAALRSVLTRFDDLLIELRDGQPRPRMSASPSGIERQVRADLPWGLIHSSTGGTPVGKGCTVAQRDQCERDAVKARRLRHGLDVDQDRATGLALSGGGIRSATFSLGILTALAKRGLLQQFDYLSTVSGGGYIGSFLTNFLERQGAAADACIEGLDANGSMPPGGPQGIDRDPFLSDERESKTIGHIRQNSRYLGSGPARERWAVALVQIYGILTNLVAFAAILGIIAASTQWISTRLDVGLAIAAGRGVPSPALLLLVLCTALAIAGMVLVPPLAYRTGINGDRLASGLTAPLVIYAVIAGYDETGRLSERALTDLPVVALASIMLPFAMLIGGTIADRIRPRGSTIGRTLSRVAAPAFLVVVFLWFTALLATRPMAAAWVFRGAAFTVAWFTFVMDVNYSGLHRHYRAKLAAAFLVSPEGQDVSEDRPLLLSKLVQSGACPYPILNAALNVPASRNPIMRGRLTDFFTYTPHHCGSPVSGYAPTTAWETADPDLDLATAMAVSGAAISPVMGLATRRQLTFWMAMTNMRLGYWARKPRRPYEKAPVKGRSRRSRPMPPGLTYLFRELFGRINERSGFLNISDGGHLENLGIYELLRRRCKLIVAVDGEQDPSMTFHAVANLQRLAAIDLDVRIDLDLDELRLDARGLSRSHFHFCRIHYPDKCIGYLMYVKLSLTGNEGEFLRRFRQDEPEFPHHPTADQNFSESRFEAYRNLGEHIGDKLFLESIAGPCAREGRVEIDDWFAQVANSMLGPETARPQGG